MTDKRLAFTIVELMTVIAIIGLMSAVALLGFTDFRKTIKLQTFSSSVHSAVRSARFQARSGTAPVRITFDLNKNKITFRECKNQSMASNIWSMDVTDLDCDPSTPSHWRQTPELPIINLPKNIIFYAYTDGENTYQVGKHHVLILPEKGNYEFSTIQLTSKPAPSRNKRCKFRTIALRPKNAPAQYYKYGKYGIFDSERPECAN